MPKSANQKLKLLYLLKMLYEQTDETNWLTVQDMIKLLAQHDIHAERKSIYDDLSSLQEFGIDIVCHIGKIYAYSIGSRTFELPELKLLVDAVQASKFITLKKSTELIKKLESLISVYDASQLQRQVFVTNRVKTFNESIYYTVDAIHSAIQANKQIAFKYFDYTISKSRKFRRNGESYIMSPYALTWEDENYYLIGYYSEHNGLSHFRVDRITEVKILDDDRVKEASQFDVAEYTRNIFNMFAGSTETVELEFDNSLINTAIDRFGKDIEIRESDNEHFMISTNVAVSPTFFGWVFQFEGKVKIKSPAHVLEKMQLMAKSII